MFQAPIRKRLFLSLPGLLCLLIACSAMATSPLRAAASPEQTLRKSADVMSKLDSLHIDFQSDVTANNSANRYTINGTAEAASSNRSSLHLTANANPPLSVISTGQEVYLQSGDGPWYQIERSRLPDNVQNALEQGLPEGVGQMLSALQNARLSDRGQETIGKVTLDHITAVFDEQSLQQMSKQFNDMLPSQWQSEQNQIKQGIADLWIDPTTSYLYQMTIASSAQLDQNTFAQISGQQPGENGNNTVPVDMIGQLNFSKFNQPITIQVPNNATPQPQP